MKKLFLILSIGLFGCFPGPASYWPMRTDGTGYRDKQISEKVWETRYAGNAYTRTSDAKAYSTIRAIQLCEKQGFKIARILDQVDLSVSKNVQRYSTYTAQNPTSVTGTVNTNTNLNPYSNSITSNSNVNATVSRGSSYGGGASWQETYNWPTFDTIFFCTNQAFVVGVNLRDLSADDMKPYVKDLLGAVQIIDIDPDAPAKGIVQVGDLVIKVNQQRIQDRIQFTKTFTESDNQREANLDIVREGKPINLKVKTKDITPIAEQSQNDLLRRACGVYELMNNRMCKQGR